MADSPARQIALESLLDRQHKVTIHLDRLLSTRSVRPAESHLASELTHGVVRRQRTLDAVIKAHSTQPGRRLPPVPEAILRLGAYQLIFLDRIPAFAAVSESVALCHGRHRRRAGFINAVLRAISRSVGPAQEGKPPLDERTVWISNDRYRVFDRPIFASPDQEPGTFLAEAASLGDDLAGRWLAEAHTLDEAVARAMHVNVRPAVIARVNLSRITVDEALEQLAAADVAAVAHANRRSIAFTGHVDIAEVNLFAEGLLSPQDPTATAVVDALDIKPGMRVLDLCAAPGTKTMQIAEAVGPEGAVVAVDVNEAKLQRITDSAQRCGYDTVEVCPAERLGSLQPESFDRVLVDAPCSNTGVLARRVEARWRFRADQLGAMAADQRQLLAMAALFASPGGKIVYSTCSIEPEENDQVVQTFVKKHPQFTVLDRYLTRPSGVEDPAQYHDGGFWAAIGHP